MDNLYHLASFLSALEWPDLPLSVQEAAAGCVADTISVSVGACGDPLLLRVGEAMRNIAGPSDAVSVWGQQRRTALSTGVLLNGMAAHTLELDDVHTASKTHIGAVTIPAAWGLAEYLGRSGRELLLAVICGYETTSRIGMALGVSSHRARGWHATATAGVFGAAAACGKLLGLNQQQMVAALGMAGTQACGLWSFLQDGATCKMLHPGRAAVSGLDAALLAQAGMTGSGHVLEAEDGGLLAAMSDTPDITYVDRGLGTDWEILRLDNKPYPCCRSTHCAIDAALALRAAHQPVAESIRSILVDTYLVGNKQCGMSPGSRNPQTLSEAKFSTPYTVAAALLYGEVSFNQFTPELLEEPRLRALLSKVSVRTDAEFTDRYPAHWGCCLTIENEDGTQVSATVTDASGSLAQPLSPAQLSAKARGLLTAAYGDQAGEKVELLLQLANLPRLPVI